MGSPLLAEAEFRPVGFFTLSNVNKGALDYLAHDVSGELRDPVGRWTRGGSGHLTAAPLRLVDNKVHPITGKVTSKPGPGMTAEQARALAAYREAAFVKINSSLRKTGGQIPPGLPGARVAQIDSAMGNSRLTRGVAVERGIGNGPATFGDRWKGDLTGTVFVDHGFVSTTTDQMIAGEFRQRPGVPDGLGATVKLSVPAGVGAIQLSGAEHESELLLERGLTYRIVADSGPGAVREMQMVVVRE